MTRLNRSLVDLIRVETTRPRQRDDDDEKLFAEWGVSADAQVFVVAAAVVVALLAAFGWSQFFGDDDSGITAALGDVAEVDSGFDGDDSSLGRRRSTGRPIPPIVVPDAGALDDADDSEVAEVVEEEVERPTTTEAATTTTEAEIVIGDVQAAVSPFAGDITGVNDGTTAVLTGFVANDAESDEAGEAAAAVEGITDVDNQLVVLEPDVVAALEGAGVTAAKGEGVGTEFTVRGLIPTEADRAPALVAASSIEGVTNVVDALSVDVASKLNDLPQVQFATGSDRILEESFDDLNGAAEILIASGGVEFEIQGYTDTVGNPASNQKLSQDRADSVRAYLLDAGVDAAQLTAKGFGPTDQFGEGDSPEALAANRLVRFEQLN